MILSCSWGDIRGFWLTYLRMRPMNIKDAHRAFAYEDGV